MLNKETVERQRDKFEKEVIGLLESQGLSYDQAFSLAGEIRDLHVKYDILLVDSIVEGVKRSV